MIAKAVTQFFAFKLNDAAKNIDEARFALFSPTGRTSEQEWADSLYITPSLRLVETPEFEFSVNALYPSATSIPPAAVLRLEAGKQNRSYPIAALPLKDKFSFKLSPGDYELKATILIGARALATTTQTISLVPELSKKLASIKADAERPGTATATTDLETLRSLMSILDSLGAGKTLETNYPAAALASEAAEIASSLKAGQAYLGPKRNGRQWVTFALPGGPLKTRISIPARTGNQTPLLIAIHGAGGSENMMFDGYGAGRIISMAETRGWIVVSPQATGTKPDSIVALIDAIDKMYHIDRSRVFVAGHSMGAMLTLATIQKSASSFAAAAAVSGGISLNSITEEVRRLPFYVSAGSDDFALAGVRKLHDALTAGGIKQLEYKEFPGIEHLMAFEVSLDGMFQVFDRISKSAGKASK